MKIEIALHTSLSLAIKMGLLPLLDKARSSSNSFKSTTRNSDKRLPLIKISSVEDMDELCM